VVDRVENLHDVALAFDGVGDEDGRALQVIERFDEESFAIARLAVQQQRVSGADGGPDLRQSALGEHHAAQSLAQCLPGEPSLGRALAAHQVRILIERNRGGAGVLVLFQAFARAHAAGFGERQQGSHVAHPHGTLHLHEVVHLEGFHDLLDDAVLQAKSGGKVLSVEIASEIENLEDEMLYRSGSKAGLLDRLWFQRDGDFCA